ncbi:hypothetical protein KP509_17G061600 [Ceratopteris richardii]|uniref:Uncharacterized protein n=1 Tax=Ceratopteris richardii TaxID=49495 RepID=A0A8T2SXH0_CERRI|nr:hypothetical protein KP509_17G061600 [Ceratopteris richardii]
MLSHMSKLLKSALQKWLVNFLSQLETMSKGRPYNSYKFSTKSRANSGDVSPERTTYLIAGAIAIALLGTAYPLLFSRKDLCHQCDGARFVRKKGSALLANAARKDQVQIVCPTCTHTGQWRSEALF